MKEIKNQEHGAKSITLFKSFFYIGLVTIGGGLAMLPIIENEFVAKRKWLTKIEMIDVFALAQSVPGVIAINTSLLTGYRIAGMRGALLASLGVMLPSFVIILTIAPFFKEAQSNNVVNKAFMGIRVAITVLMAFAVFGMIPSVLRDPFTIAIFTLSFIATVFLNVNIIIVILVAGALGFISYPIKKCFMKNKEINE